MSGVEWIFIGGTSGVMAAAFADKLSETYGFYWIGEVLRILTPAASIAAGAYVLGTSVLAAWLS